MTNFPTQFPAYNQTFHIGKDPQKLLESRADAWSTEHSFGVFSVSKDENSEIRLCHGFFKTEEDALEMQKILKINTNARVFVEHFLEKNLYVIENGGFNVVNSIQNN